MVPLALAAWLLMGAPLAARARVSATPGPITDEEQRLVPEIIRKQEARVQEAARAADTAHDTARALRLRQRMLAEHGRDDLAVALEPEAVKRESAEGGLRQTLADEEDALLAYREYAGRAGIPRETAASSESETRAGLVPPAARHRRATSRSGASP
jgi:hypothetical protein